MNEGGGEGEGGCGVHKLLHSSHAVLLNVVLSDVPQNLRSKRVLCRTYGREFPLIAHCMFTTNTAEHISF